MELFALMHGIFVGVLISAPVGPVAVLCMQNTLSGRRRSGVFTGLGAAIADTIYAVIALKGVKLSAEYALLESPGFEVAVGVVLIGFAVRIWYSKPRQSAPSVKITMMGGALLQGFVLTIINPVAVLVMVTLFATLDAVAPLWAALGVFLGALGWWTVLAMIVGNMHHKLDTVWIERINHFFAVVILVFGCAAIIDGLLTILGTL